MQLGTVNEIVKDLSCFCCIKMGSLYVTTQIPSSGYVPGQTIVTTMNYKNLASVRISKISAKLERVSETVKILNNEWSLFHNFLFKKLEFHATSKIRTEYCEITSITNSGPFPLEGQVVLTINVPPILPSYLAFCSIINLHYNLKIIVHFPGLYVKKLNNIYAIMYTYITLAFRQGKIRLGQRIFKCFHRLEYFYQCNDDTLRQRLRVKCCYNFLFISSY